MFHSLFETLFYLNYSSIISSRTAIPHPSNVIFSGSSSDSRPDLMLPPSISVSAEDLFHLSSQYMHSEAKRLKALEEENNKLKRLLADMVR
jgi:hypothetical protein